MVEITTLSIPNSLKKLYLNVILNEQNGILFF